MDHRTFDRNLLQVALNEIGVDGDAIRETYGGRAMYGETCFGVTLDGVRTFGLMCATLGELAAGKDYDVIQLLESVRSDSMGKSDTIFYFPGWLLREGTFEEDE